MSIPEGFLTVHREGVAMLAPAELELSSTIARVLDQTEFGRRRARWINRALVELDKIASGWRPLDEDLAAAPIIMDWEIVPKGRILTLTGLVQGHPKIGDGHRVTTSAVIAVDTAAFLWVRTISRFYVLRPASH